MSTLRKTIWIAFAIFMLVQLGSSYLTHKNQDNLSFLMEMQSYIPYMLYFSLIGIVLFILSFMVYQLDGRKKKKQIARLEQDKNELKAKLFDMQEAKSSKDLPALKTSPQTEPRQEIGSAEETSSPDTE